MESEIVSRIRELTEIGGTIAALAFTGTALHIDARVRRAETVIEITKQHRELWQLYFERPSLHGLLSKGRDMRANPLTLEEAWFAGEVLNHLRATFYARRAMIFRQPERLAEDVREFLRLPAPRAAWEAARRYHDPRFAAFVESMLG